MANCFDVVQMFQIVGIALRNTNLVFVQISLLTALVVIADLAAFSSGFTLIDLYYGLWGTNVI
jgi:hypothetical protein